MFRGELLESDAFARPRKWLDGYPWLNAGTIPPLAVASRQLHFLPFKVFCPRTLGLDIHCPITRRNSKLAPTRLTAGPQSRMEQYADKKRVEGVLKKKTWYTKQRSLASPRSHKLIPKQHWDKSGKGCISPDFTSNIWRHQTLTVQTYISMYIFDSHAD